MLRELHISNFAIIDELHLTLERGFNILTGETGAGKSIVIDAVALLLGGRADVTAIRAGAARAQVEGLFLLSPAHQATLAPWLAAEGLDSESPEALWLSRELRDNGRSVARINGSVVAVSLLRDLAERLVDVHGQSEHLSLLRVQEHRNLLDRYGNLLELRERVAVDARELQAIRRELHELRVGEQERMQRIDLLRFQVQEIESVAPHPGEIEELETEQVRLANAEQLTALASHLLALLIDGGEDAPAMLDLLGQAQREANALARVDTSFATRAEALAEIGYQIEDLGRFAQDYLGEIEFSPRRLERVEDRLVLLRQLQRKYGGDLDAVLVHARRSAAELEKLEHSDERIAELETVEAALLAQVAALSLELSEKRQQAARALAAGIEAELQDLRMEGARFGVAFQWREAVDGLPVFPAQPGERWITTGEAVHPEPMTLLSRVAFDLGGMDRIEFLIAPNIGEGLKPMARIASGGETARLMLALKTVLSRADETPTLIFDEIDQGIGGRVGAIVGAKLWQLTLNAQGAAGQHQVLCITHLPQLAGFGDAHYRVLKSVTEGRTVTHVAPLTEAERLTELASMLGTQGEAAQQGAQELLAQAAQAKRTRIAAALA